MIELVDGVVIEQLDDEFVALRPHPSDLIRLTGPSADALRLVLAGAAWSEVPAELDEAVALLVDLGLVHQPSGPSRRTVFQLGAAAAVGAFVLALPDAAAAQSLPGGGDPGGGPGGGSIPATPQVAESSLASGSLRLALSTPGGATSYEYSINGSAFSPIAAVGGVVTVAGVAVGDAVRLRGVNAVGSGPLITATAATTSTTIAYGGATTFVVPAGVTLLEVDLYGGTGGPGGAGRQPIGLTGGNFFPGRPGKQPERVRGTLTVTPGETLEVYPGQAGGCGTYSLNTAMPGGGGGANALGSYRGGDGGIGRAIANIVVPVGGSGGGGGAGTVLRRGSDVLAVAGGAPGGAGSPSTGQSVDQPANNSFLTTGTTDGGKGADTPSTQTPGRAGGGGGGGGRTGGLGGQLAATIPPGSYSGHWGTSHGDGLDTSEISFATGRTLVSTAFPQAPAGTRGQDGSITFTSTSITII